MSCLWRAEKIPDSSQVPVLPASERARNGISRTTASLRSITRDNSVRQELGPVENECDRRRGSGRNQEKKSQAVLRNHVLGRNQRRRLQRRLKEHGGGAEHQ